MDDASPAVVCSNCGSQNPDGFRFCGSCGAGLELPCPSCGAVMPSGFAFCGSCGSGLSPKGTAAAGSGERKVVSVLFADLVASTELATRLDPEDLHGLYGSYFDAIATVVTDHGGTLEKFIGDAVVGVFGVPVTLGDDPERAVRAGLAMQAAMTGLNREVAPRLGRELALRVGIHTGEVISGSGPDQALATGETTSIAARLQAAAPIGGVAVSERTLRDVAGSFETEALGELDLKGVAEPVTAWAVVGTVARSEVGSDRPLVGRADELALLDVLLRRTERDGRPHLVTVVGAAGVGKSRLTYEFTRRAGARMVRGRCLPYGSGLPLWPLAEIVKSDATILESDPPDVISAKARDRIGRRFAAVDADVDALPTILSSIGLPADPDPLAGVGREAGEQMILNAWAAYLTALASPGPLIVWIEDAHWGDGALLDLLDRLVGRVPAPVLFVCPARPELLERRPAWLARVASVSTIELPPLPTTEGVSLVEGLFDGDATPELTEMIAARAGGNPFFATELVRNLIEEGAIERADGVWLAAGDISASMPDSVQLAVVARIDRLVPEDKTVVQLASVVGRVFWAGGLDELRGAPVGTALDSLVSRGLIRPRPSSRIAGSREYTFEHALIQEVVYGSIPRSRRPAMHRAVLDWVEGGTRGRDEEFAELLAFHAELAGDRERTAPVRDAGGTPSPARVRRRGRPRMVRPGRLRSWRAPSRKDGDPPIRDRPQPRGGLRAARAIRGCASRIRGGARYRSRDPTALARVAGAGVDRGRPAVARAPRGGRGRHPAGSGHMPGGRPGVPRAAAHVPGRQPRLGPGRPRACTNAPGAGAEDRAGGA